MEIIGKQIEMGVAIEGARGVAESVATKWIKNVNCDIVAKADKVIDDNSQGVLEDSPNSRVVGKYFAGEFAGIAHADVIGYKMLQIYGTVNTSTVSGAVKDHAFSMLQNIEHPTLSFFVKDGGVNQEVFSNGVIGTYELTAKTDDFVRDSTSVEAITATSNADTPSYDTEYDWISRDITVKVASSEAGLSGATALKLKELTLTWDTGAIRDQVFGSYNSNDIYNAKMSIEGSFVKNYEDDTFKDLFTSDTAVYMQVVIAGDAVLAGSNRPTFTMVLNKVQVQDWSRSGGNDELVTEDVSFKAFYNNTDSEQSTVTVRNVTASYEVTS